MLRVARRLVGRKGLAMSFERSAYGLRVWGGHHYGPGVSIDIDVRGAGHLCETPKGTPKTAGDVVDAIVRKLRALR